MSNLAETDRATVMLPASPDDAATVIGAEFVGEWMVVDEERLAAFDHAAYVEDNVVEMDVERYPDGLVEGFQLVALIERLHRGGVVAEDEGLPGSLVAIERLRFSSPVHAGERMRTRGVVTAVETSARGIEIELDAKIEIEGRSKPGFVVRWRQLWSADRGGEARSKTVRPGPLEKVSSQDHDAVAVVAPLEQFAAMVGRPFRSDWVVVEAERRDSFVLARSVVGDTISPAAENGSVSSLHLVALLDHLVNPVVHPSAEPWFGWNYGLDDVRFDREVYPGDRVRVRGTVTSIDARGEGQLVRMECFIEIEGQTGLALSCQWLTLWLANDD